MSGGGKGGGFAGDDEPTIERKKWKEFDCPDCSANNPTEDGFYENSELQCFYCGSSFKVSIHDGKPKLKAID